MPNIAEYNAPVRMGEVSDRASSVHVSAGRRIAQQYNETGQAIDSAAKDIGGTVAMLGKAYLDYQTHKEVSAGGLHASSLILNATQQWNDGLKNSDPNDPTVQPKFLEGLNKSLEQFRESFTTQKGQEWADHRINAIREHFNTLTTADTSTMAGIAINNNAVQSINNYSGAALKDPASLGVLANLFKQDLEDLVGSSPTLKGTAAFKVKTELMQKGMEQIVRSAISGDIRAGGDGKRIADDERFSPYVNAVERDRMVTEARQQDRLAKMETREQARWQKEQAQYRSDDTVIKFRDRMGPDAVGEPLTRAEINREVDAGNLTRRDFEHILALQDHYANKEPTDARKSAANYRPLLDQIRDGSMSTLSPIWAAESRGDINRTDADRLTRAFKDMSSPEGSSLQKEQGQFMTQARKYIDKSMFGTQFGEGAIKFYEFERDVDRKVQEYRRLKKDPHDLFDPSKPDYVGSKANLDKYIPPMEVMMRNAISGALAPGNRPPLSSFDGSR